MTVEELNALANEFYEYLENQENFYEVWPDGNDTICVEVSWGDWKHDHLRLDYLAEKFFTEKGYDILSTNEDVTDEDGSDTYSAIHSYRLRKHVEESLNESKDATKKAFEALNALRDKMTDGGYLDSDEVEESTLYNGNKCVEFAVRHWGKWETPQDAEDDEDYDWQILSQSSIEKLQKLVSEYSKRYGVDIRFQIGEKNWIYLEVEIKNKKEKEESIKEDLNFSKIRFEINDDGDTIATDGNNYLILGDAELMDESDSVKKIYLKRTIDELNKYPETKSEYKYWMSILNK